MANARVSDAMEDSLLDDLRPIQSVFSTPHSRSCFLFDASCAELTLTDVQASSEQAPIIPVCNTIPPFDHSSLLMHFLRIFRCVMRDRKPFLRRPLPLPKYESSYSMPFACRRTIYSATSETTLCEFIRSGTAAGCFYVQRRM
jgi:hypothetical protein